VAAGPEQLPNLEVQESPTIVEPAATAQWTEPVSQIDTAEPSFEVRLSTVWSGAKVLRRGGITEVQQAQSANLQVDDGVAVVKLEEQSEQSYSILDFSDYLEVELFSNTSVFITDLKQENVTLRLDTGNMFVHLNDQKTSRVTVKTLDTTITTLTDGTEFDVCYNEELTCVLVKRGVVVVTAQGGQQIVKAGEAGYVFKDEHPSPPLCAPTSVFTAWEDRYRQFAAVPSLDVELSLLQQKPCRVTAAGLPINARILYQDEFRRPSSGWTQGEIDNFIVGYYRLPGRRQYRYYQVQVQGPNDQYLASVPNEHVYGDVNIDTKVAVEEASSGDFLYGLVFRRSGDQYYAFITSPVTKTWYFLKSSSTGLETLREGTDEHIRGLKAKDTLRVESYGSTFLVYINGRFIDWISDPDYASGEVGLFVESMDSPDAIINFDSIIIWDMPPAVLNPITGGREYCFNARDDDGDRLTDRADPDCQRLGLTSTSLPPPTSTARPTNTLPSRPTHTLQPTNTPIPQPTNTPGPTNTRRPTRTRTPQPTNPPPPTNTPQPPTNPPPTNTPQPPTDPPPTDPPTTPPYP
jgi:FecR protein